MKLFDTHCHYNLAPLATQVDDLIAAAQAAGVGRAMVVGTDVNTSQQALKLKANYPHYFLASVGIHPEYSLTINNKIDWNFLLTDAADAYGEIGFDFYHLPADVDRATIIASQQQLLQQQLTVMKAKPKPIIFHLRDDDCRPNDQQNAYGLILATIKQAQIENWPLIFHCFSGNSEYLQQVLQLPHSYISFAGNLTFNNAPNLRALCRQVPADRLLLETDAPFLAPVPKRGGDCLPAYLRLTATFAAEQLGLDLDQIWQNSLDVFARNRV